MLTIKIARLASLDNIATKHHDAIRKVDNWSKILCSVLGCEFYGLYVRGSVPLGCATTYSDLDLAVLLSHSCLNQVVSIKASITALIARYIFPCPVHVKVFNVDAEGYAQPPACLSDELHDLSKKYITFDLHANGICFTGQKVLDASTIYQSSAEFKKINYIMWGLEIRELVDNMNYNHLFHSYQYYPLIKKCIRLAAYIAFRPDSLYYGTTEDCFQWAIQTHDAIQKELVFLYDYFKNRTLDWSLQKETVHQYIEIVTEYLLLEFGQATCKNRHVACPNN